MKKFLSISTVRALLASLATMLILLAYHATVILSPNSYLFGDQVDGLKNYYTPLYHILYDDSYSWFKGMNYPYGDHIVFADAQPIFSGMIKFISTNIIDISGYTVGLINLAMFLSIPLSAFIISKVLNRLKVEGFWNMAGAIFMALLAPQIFRMGGHFALAYSFVIPLTIWFWLWQFHKPNWKKGLVIGLSISAIAGLHFYYFAIMTFFLGIAHGFRFLTKERLPFSQTAIQVLLQIVLPFMLLQTWLELTDPITDRPNNPFGFLAYRAYWESIFLPVGKPLGGYINVYITQIRNLNWEGIAYVGLPAFIFTLAFLILWPLKKLKVGLPSTFNHLVVSSVFLLLFAMGIPFIFGLEWVVEYLGPLKQFRGIGRFGWLFYYVINICFFVWWSNQVWRRAWIKPVFGVLVFLILGYEVHTVHQKQFYQKNQIKVFHNPPPISAINSDKNNYSAILPIPFFLTGSENIWYSTEGSKSLKLSLETSIKTGLPIVGVQMSRTSLTQTLGALEIVTAPINELPWLKNKPHLIVRDTGVSLPKNERDLLKWAKAEQGTKVFSAASWNDYQVFWKDSIKSQMSDSQNMENPIFYQSYNAEKTEGFSGSGLSFDLREYTKLFNLKAKRDTGQYTCSFWYFLNKDVLPTVNLVLETFNQHGELINYQAPPVFTKIKAIRGNWGLIEVKLELGKNQYCNGYLHKGIHRKKMGLVDEVLIIKQGDGFVNKSNGFFNNLPL